MITNSCIEWDGLIGNHGYGYAEKKKLAHRLVWEENFGPIPAGMMICHHCDNPPCVNIDHLFLGTQKDNLHDAMSKGRWHSGMVGYRRTVCFNGLHDMTPENTYVFKDRARGEVRRCRLCRLASTRQTRKGRKQK